MKIQEALEILMKIKLQFGGDLEIVVQSVDQDGYDDVALIKQLQKVKEVSEA